MRARNNREIPDMLQFNPNSYFTCVAYIGNIDHQVIST